MRVLLILILSFICVSFTPKEGVIKTVIIDTPTYDTEVYSKWQPSNSGYWTKYGTYNVYNDFDWQITKSVYLDAYGYYYYDFWFYSQSYYWDGYNAKYAATNLKNISIWVDGVLIISDQTPLGITFNGTFNATRLRFRSMSTTPVIQISWGIMQAK